MSAQPAEVAGLPALAPPVPQPVRPFLRLVPRLQPRAHRAPFVALVLVLLAGGLVGLLLLNTVVAQQAFTIHRLQERGAALALTEQQFQRTVADAQAPAVLAARARALGMVPAPAPLFLRLSDGAILGVPITATPPPAPAVPPATTSKATTSKATTSKATTSKATTSKATTSKATSRR